MGADTALHHVGALTCLKPRQGLIILRLVFLSLSALKNAFVSRIVFACPPTQQSKCLHDRWATLQPSKSAD